MSGVCKRFLTKGRRCKTKKATNNGDSEEEARSSENESGLDDAELSEGDESTSKVVSNVGVDGESSTNNAVREHGVAIRRLEFPAHC
jgi:hypothetical protein